jgi:hydroxycarboxylate dehydrogenase B
MLIQAAALQSLVADTFTAAGCSAVEGARIARYLVSANLTGHDSHGVIRVPRYVQALKDGNVVADQTIAVLSETDSLAVVDGRFGFGQTVTPQAVELGIAKTRKNGVAVVALRNSGHLGRAGDWAAMAADAGLISIHFVNVAGSLLVAPFGGVDRRISTAPFAIAVPVPGEPHLILDFATSLVAEGKVLVASQGGKKVPEDALITPEGKLTSDPAVLYGPLAGNQRRDPRQGPGAIRTFGEHKGSGLAFFCEILAGALTGGGTAGPAPRKSVTNGMLSVYMAPDFFQSSDRFAEEVRSYVAFYKSSRAATPNDAVLVPGEPESRSRAKRLAEGIPLTEDTWAAISQTALAAGVEPLRISQATLNV